MDESVDDMNRQINEKQKEIDGLEQIYEAQSQDVGEQNKFLLEENAKVKEAMEKLTFKIYKQQTILNEVEPRMQQSEKDWT